MDGIDRACKEALRGRRAAYLALQRNPSAETRAAHDAALRAWQAAVAQQVARMEPWRIKPRRGPIALKTIFAFFPHTHKPAPDTTR